MTDSRILPQWHLVETSDDASLVHAARDGDRNAFGRLYSRYSRMVHGILLARVHSTEVNDLVQDVFLTALPRLGGLRDATRFGGWLAAITRNRAIDYHRQSQAASAARQTLSEPDVYVQATNDPACIRAETILELIRSLPNAYRETLILRLVEGMNGPEIAARTGLTPGSVRVNLHRGMRQLREKLDGAMRKRSTP
jgi:RNA polymerase sigma-70 factor (ECF subfamily)